VLGLVGRVLAPDDLALGDDGKLAGGVDGQGRTDLDAEGGST